MAYTVQYVQALGPTQKLVVITPQIWNLLKVDYELKPDYVLAYCISDKTLFV